MLRNTSGTGPVSGKKAAIMRSDLKLIRSLFLTNPVVLGHPDPSDQPVKAKIHLV